MAAEILRGSSAEPPTNFGSGFHESVYLSHAALIADIKFLLKSKQDYREKYMVYKFFLRSG